jgi:hypothetical protein
VKNISMVFLVQIIVIITIILFHFAEALQEVSIDNGTINNHDSVPYSSNRTNLSNNKGHSEIPKIAVSGNNLYVAWIDDTSGKRDIFFKKSIDYGCTFRRTIDLNNQNGGSVDPQIAVSGSNVYVTWEHSPEDNGGVFFTRSTDAGESFERITNIGNNTGFNGFPQIAVSGNNVYLVWHDATHGILFTRSTDGGKSFERIKNVGDDTGFNGFPQIAVSGNNLYLVWTNNAPEKYGQIYFTRSTDDGKSFEKPTALGEAKNKNEDIQVSSPKLTLDSADNRIFVVWHGGRIVHQNTGNYDVLISDVFYKRSTDGGKSFEKLINLSNYSGWGINPQIAFSQNNTVYVIWTNNAQQYYGQIYFTRSTDGGKSFEKLINLSNYSGWGIDPQIAFSQNNTVYVIWTNNAQEYNAQDYYGQIYFTRSTDGGKSFERIKNAGDDIGFNGFPQIALSDNNVYLAWTSNDTGNEEIIFKEHHISNNCTRLIRPDIYENSDNNTTRNVNSKTPNIAFINPTFTYAAYDKAFYLFYPLNKESRASNITKYKDLLSSIVPSDDESLSATSYMRNHLKWLSPNSNIDLLTDRDVDNGSLIFTDNGTNRYDIIMLGHQEYVTQNEYDNLKRFVATGGILFLLDGNVFYAEVSYNKNTNTISLVKGHEWASNGKTAWPSVQERWAHKTSKWIGSNYLCCSGDKIIFNNNPFGIKQIEEQHVTNPRAKILLDYNATEKTSNPRNFVIATYELDYKKGKVIVLGLFTDYFEGNDRFWRFIDSLFYQYALREDSAKYQYSKQRFN